MSLHAKFLGGARFHIITESSQFISKRLLSRHRKGREQKLWDNTTKKKKFWENTTKRKEFWENITQRKETIAGG